MNLLNYKYLVVGSGLFGAIIAERIATDLNEKVLVIEKRDHIGGNCASEKDDHTGIEYHKYGTHIFHTSNAVVWKYINRFTEFNSYYHQVLITYKDNVYQMPINLETINAFYKLNLKPFEVDDFLASQIAKEISLGSTNFEEKAISMIGRPLYEAFIRGYTKKQWGKDPKLLPASILTRLPFRYNYNESYYNDRWQGVPLDGYSTMFAKMLDHPNIKVKLNVDFFDLRAQIPPETIVIYSGPIDQYFDYKFGRLEWRTLDFEKEVINVSDYQGTSVMNYGEEDIPFTRIHEPRHLHNEREADYPEQKTVIFREFSKSDNGDNPYYPINDTKNHGLIVKYLQEKKKLKNVIIGGRLGRYEYLDMDDTIADALDTYECKIKKKAFLL